MYNCEFCGVTVPAKTSCVKIITKTREVIFPQRSYANRLPGKPVHWSPDNGGKGVQIVEEKNACPACAKEHREKSDWK